MADWIKVLTTLPKCRAVYRLMRELRCKRHAALGLAVDWLCWLDANSSDGRTGLLDEEISDVLGWPKAAEALNAIGWVSHDEQGCVVAVDFKKHCGESGKKRADDAARQQRSRARRDACHTKSVTDVTNFCDQRREEYNDTVVGSSTVCGGGVPLPAPPPDGFKGWLSALCEAHPSARQSRVLAPDVEAEAREAFVRCPQAAEQAELLRAYFEDRMQEDRFRKPFYRPQGQGRFFHDLEDVLAHAVRWARESGWGRRRKAASAAEGGKGAEAPCSDGAAASDAEREAFFKELRGNLR